MKKGKKFLAILLTVCMVVTLCPVLAMAGETPQFADMPDDWSTVALNNAVKNGLIKGYDSPEGTLIKATGTLTRAEMATVVNRAFAADKQASLSGVKDVASGDWFASEMAKAVQMGTMKLSDTMRPNDNITRQEAFTILARAFKLECKDATHSALNAFGDKGMVADWATESMCALVEAGYVSGAGGMLTPTANITRAEFAKIMDNMVKQYITVAGTVTSVEAGNVMVNVPGVTLEGVTISGNLILGDGVGEGNVTLNNVKVTGDTIVRGGGVNSIIVKGNSDLGKIIIGKVDGNVRVAVEGNAKVDVVVIADGKDDVVVEGNVATLEVAIAEVPVVVQNAKIEEVVVAVADADLTVGKGATVETVKAEAVAPTIKVEAGATVKTVEASKEAVGAKIEVEKGATITTVNAAAEKTEIAGAGKVETANVTGDNVKVDTAGTKTTVSAGASGVTAGDKPVTSGTTTTTPGTAPVVSGGGGGGGGTPTIVTATVRGSGPAEVLGDDNFNYADAYKDLGISITNATNKNSNTVTITVPGTLDADADNVDAALKNGTTVYVGVQFNKPSGATGAEVTINDGTPFPVDLTTENQRAHNGQYIQYFGVADENGPLFREDAVVEITWKNGAENITPISKYTVKRVVTDVVAGIEGGNAYPTLDAAIAATADGNTVKLLADVTLTETIVYKVDKKITLDLNGHTISKDDTPFSIEQGTFNVTGEGIIQETENDKHAPIVIKGSTNDVANYTNVTIGEDVTLKGWSGVFIRQNTDNKASGVVVNMNGKIVSPASSGHTAAGHGIYINGNIQHTENCPIINIGETADITARGDVIYAAGYANWTIDGGTFEGNNGIEIKAGGMVINGGTFEATGTVGHEANSNGTSTSGYVLAVVENQAYGNPVTVTVNDGNFTGPIAILDDDDNTGNNDGSLKIAGGTFDDISAFDYLTSNSTATIIAKESMTIDSGTYDIKSDVTFEIPNGVTFTANGTAKIINDGTVLVKTGGILDLSDIPYSASGLVPGKAGSLSIEDGGTVKMLKDFGDATPNFMNENSETFFDLLEDGAKMYTGGNSEKLWIYNGTLWEEASL